MEAEQVQFSDEERAEIDKWYVKQAEFFECSVEDVKKDFTLLHYVAEFGKIELIKSLIEAGMDVNVRTEFGNTPLFYAAEDEKIELVKFLIETGADVNLANKGTVTPLFSAIACEQIEVAKFLISHGADVNVRVDIHDDLMEWEKTITLLDLVVQDIDVAGYNEGKITKKQIGMLEYLLSVGARQERDIENKCTQQEYASAVLDEYGNTSRTSWNKYSVPIPDNPGGSPSRTATFQE